jgi:hypothetical protein
MQVITCVSFHSTGSSVVDDIFKECSNCVSAPSDIECRFLQDPDGISDLEYNLIDNPHRLNSEFAIKRYMRFVKRYSHTYKFIFGNEWERKSKEYINALVTVKYRGFWFRDLELMPTKELIIYWFKRIITLIKNPHKRIAGYYVDCPREMFFHSYLTAERFTTLTKSYVRGLCEALNPENKPFVLLDQCVPTSNIQRYTKYFDNIKVIVVDRDPRDVYIEHKHSKDHVLPNSPKEFCEVYRDQRNMFFASNKDNVLYLRFEDFIYNYENTVNRLFCFVGQSSKEHSEPQKYFNPDISAKNMRLWERYPQYRGDIEIIESLLPEFLYKDKN